MSQKGVTSVSGALAGLAGNYGSDESGDEGDTSSAQPIWSVCIDAATGCPYYWEQITNQVSWEPPPGFANQTGTFANRVPSIPLSDKLPRKKDAKPKLNSALKSKFPKDIKKNRSSDEDEEKIELITSFYNSDTGSEDETGNSNTKNSKLKNNLLKRGKKDNKVEVQYGPELPSMRNNKLIHNDTSKDSKDKNKIVDSVSSTKADKAKSDDLDKKLNPSKDEFNSLDVNYQNSASRNSVNSRTHSLPSSPNGEANSPALSRKSTLDMDVDDLIAQIEKEQPLDKTKMSSDTNLTGTSQEELATDNSTTATYDDRDVFKPLFPSCSQPVESDVKSEKKENDVSIKPDDKPVNKYDGSANDIIDSNALKRKRRIALDVLPVKQVKTEPPSNNSYYTSSERIGLGFKSDLDESENNGSDTAAKYSNFKKGDSLVFQKGESLKENSEKTDNGEDKFDDMQETKLLIEAKLKFLTKSLSKVPPVQQLNLEFQTLWEALTSGALQKKYMNEWLQTANTTLSQLEVNAAPHPWICKFHSGAGCYVYEHPETGQWQWDYPEQDNLPQPPSTPPPAKPPVPQSPPPDEPSDMDISTTPPPSNHDGRSHLILDENEPLPPGVETPTGFSPMPLEDSIASDQYMRKNEPRTEDDLCAELSSFYSDLAALDDVVTTTDTNSKESTSEDPSKPSSPTSQSGKSKKKKLKTKTSLIGMKNKSVSKLVAKWKKVQETLED